MPTWTYANGTVTVVGGAPRFAVAAGGRLMIAGQRQPNDGTSVLLILTRLR